MRNSRFPSSLVTSLARKPSRDTTTSYLTEQTCQIRMRDRTCQVVDLEANVR